MLIRPRKTLPRRHFLRNTGVLLGLPLLAAMEPNKVLAADHSTGDSHAAGTPRTVAICAGLGFHAPFLFPEQPGRIDDSTPYLRLLQEHRSEFTLFSGLSHPEQNGNNGHASGLTWLTSARRPGLAGFKNTVSLDQLIASHLGGVTRFPYLCLANGGGSLSWTANGVNIPSQSSPAKLFKQMFVDGSADQVRDQMRELDRGRSILDTVLGEAQKLNRRVGKQDREKLDEYFSSIRDLETRIGQSQQWTTRPKPAVDYPQPNDVPDKTDVVARQRLMYDMMLLALQTDSSRVITLSLGGMNQVPSNIPGVKTDWHNLSHHGKDESKIDELKLIEAAEFTEFSRFLGRLKSVKEQGRSLLDETAVLFGSNLGNASAHDWHNLPIILAGGGYQHGSYVAHDKDNNTPLANVFVSLAQRMGVETDRFGSSTAESVHGLERA